MATILRDGFDSYSTDQQMLDTFTSMNGATTLSATTRFGHGQSMNMDTSGLNNEVQWTKTFPNSGDTIFVNFAFRRAGVLSGINSDKFFIMDGTTVHLTIRFIGNGSIEFWRGNLSVGLGTYVGAFPGNGTWNHFQFKFVIHNTLGSIEVRRDGSDFNDFELIGTVGTPLDTQNSANAFANRIEMQMADNNPSGRQYDDMWIFDNTVVAGEPSDWIGDVRAWQIVPNSDSSVTLSRSAGATNFSNVDEAVQSSADYVFGATPGLVDEYGNAGFVVPLPENILGLSVRVAAQKMDAGSRTHNARVRSGATAADTTAKNLTSGVLVFAFPVDLNPDTGLAWTAAEIAAMTFGPRITT